MYAMQDKSRTMESDAFFKSIPEDWYDNNSGTGDVESPTGWFGLVTIDADTFRVAWEAGDFDQIPASVEDGLYLVTIDSNGLVWAEQAPVDSATRANYAEKCAEYAVWLSAELDAEDQSYNDRHGL